MEDGRSVVSKKDLMNIIGRKFAAGSSLFLFVSASLLVAQNQAQVKPGGQQRQQPAQTADKGSPETGKVPDHARAYYHYMLARRFKELAGVQNRSDFAERAISEYKQAIEADPDSLFLR